MTASRVIITYTFRDKLGCPLRSDRRGFSSGWSWVLARNEMTISLLFTEVFGELGGIRLPPTYETVEKQAF